MTSAFSFSKLWRETSRTRSPYKQHGGQAEEGQMLKSRSRGCELGREVKVGRALSQSPSDRRVTCKCPVRATLEG